MLWREGVGGGEVGYIYIYIYLYIYIYIYIFPLICRYVKAFILAIIKGQFV